MPRNKTFRDTGTGHESRCGWILERCQPDERVETETLDVLPQQCLGCLQYAFVHPAHDLGHADREHDVVVVGVRGRGVVTVQVGVFAIEKLAHAVRIESAPRLRPQRRARCNHQRHDRIHRIQAELPRHLAVQRL